MYEYQERIQRIIWDNEDYWCIDNDKELEELQEVYSKAKAYDLLREDIEINEKVFKQQAENDEVSAIIHGHYLALLGQSELEGADDER
ncbi:hypothetical protein [Staphylococcus saprophyticus]|uniref:hypothetical protein n=1 Tax=Staphylococcus saprophyticus TaxID=29385 RepID=UPI00101025B5|nr:hypothetical protein [Staphylococcus saprophyticus]RXR97257.1 hypothetical protein EUA48_06235 [Staphylococcus saprophyticus]